MYAIQPEPTDKPTTEPTTEQTTEPTTEPTTAPTETTTADYKTSAFGLTRIISENFKLLHLL